ncbi:hypothetical protein B1B00_00480 [Bacillus sp. DSM 27956]|nr:hypothetical protein B1B00_00480 [Bacillus sp. DSM 27956]
MQNTFSVHFFFILLEKKGELNGWTFEWMGISWYLSLYLVQVALFVPGTNFTLGAWYTIITKPKTTINSRQFSLLFPK